MNFQQLKAVRETVERKFNLSEVALAMKCSQPGVSRQIRELERELGFDLFVRLGGRLTALTTLGREILPIVNRMVLDERRLRLQGGQATGRYPGRLSVATTHSQARYVLPPVVDDFRRAHPNVKLTLHQGTPAAVTEMVSRGEADVGITMDVAPSTADLLFLRSYRWSHCIVAPVDHELGSISRPTLADLARYPLITHDEGSTVRSQIDQAFRQVGLRPEFALTAMDADVIKAYVELRLGIGIVAAFAFDPERDRALLGIDAGHLFALNETQVVIRRDAFHGQLVYDFITTYSPPLTRRQIDLVRCGYDDELGVPGPGGRCRANEMLA